MNENDFDYVDAGATPYDGGPHIGRDITDLGWPAPHGNQMRVDASALHARWGPDLWVSAHERAVYNPMWSNVVRITPRHGESTGPEAVFMHHRYGLPNSHRWVRHHGRLIDEFIKVTRPDDVLPFARRWGLLGPMGWNGDVPHTASEPLDYWVASASAADATLRLIGLLHKGLSKAVETDTLSNRVPAIDRWLDLVQPPARIGKMRGNDAANTINAVVDVWLEHFGAPELGVHTEGAGTVPRFGWRVRSLGAAIGAQLILAVSSGAARIAVCTECLALYPPRRRPSPGQDTYCDEHKDTAAARNRKQRERARRVE